MELCCTVEGFPSLRVGCTNDYQFTFVMEGDWNLPEEVTFRCFPTCDDHLYVFSDCSQWNMTFSRNVRKASIHVDVTAIVEGQGRLRIHVVNHHGMPVASVAQDIVVQYCDSEIDWVEKLRTGRLPGMARIPEATL